MPAVNRAWFLSMLAAATAGCAAGTGDSPPPPPLPVEVQSLAAAVVLPGTRATLRGAGFLSGGQIEVTLDAGPANGVLALPVERVDDQTLSLTFPPEQVRAIGEGALTADLTVDVDVGEAHGEATSVVHLEVRHGLEPSVVAVQPSVFPQTPFTLSGGGLLGPGEGLSLVSLRGTFTPETEATPFEVSVTEVAVEPGQDPTTGIDRANGTALFESTWMGISPGRFEGEVQIANQGEGWTRQSGWTPVGLDLLPPTIETFTPGAASRGERITITGQGFLGAEAGTTFIRLEGEFHPADGDPRPLPEGGLEISPVWLNGNTLAFSMRVRYDADCQSRDLGANPGVMIGTATPVITRDDETVEGAATAVQFEILPSKQVVWLRFLPAFTDSLRIFGLRNVSGAVQDRILEVLRRDYAGVNMDFRLVEPQDFLDFAILEIGGPDPNGQQLFGLDNTPDLDHCNERLADNLAGRNADGAGFGGIFVESFLQFSPAGGSENPLADPAFDALFAGVRDTPVEAGEYPDGDRSEEIARAIYALGSLVGNTATHELGHSLGLPVFPGCGEYHTAPGPLQIMDCGADRPFVERAELEGEHAAFNPEDLEYLQQVLPL